MRHRFIDNAVLLACGLGLALAPFALTAANAGETSPSFSCRNVVADSAEDIICSDSQLAQQDRTLASTFARARAAVRGSEGLGELLSSQQNWIRERNACASLRTQKGYCIQTTTEQRISSLNQWASLRMNPERAQRVPQKTGTTQSSRPPSGPSFNCSNARTRVERAICNSRELSIQDREVASLYRRLQTLLASNPNHVRFAATDQREFIANRNQCERRVNDLMACLQVSYENRIQRLGELIEEQSSR